METLVSLLVTFGLIVLIVGLKVTLPKSIKKSKKKNSCCS